MFLFLRHSSENRTRVAQGMSLGAVVASYARSGLFQLSVELFSLTVVNKLWFGQRHPRRMPPPFR